MKKISIWLFEFYFTQYTLMTSNFLAYEFKFSTEIQGFHILTPQAFRRYANYENKSGDE